MGAPPAYSTIASLPALTGAWRDRGGGCAYIPLATAAAVSDYALRREDLRPGPVRTINMSQIGEALTDPSLDPPVKAFVCWNSNPAAIAPDQERVLEGLRRDDLFVVVLEQFMTDTAALADVVLPATTQLEHRDVLFSWGHHYLTFNEPAIEPQGEAKPNTETFRLLAAPARVRRPLLRRGRRRADRRAAGRLRRGRPAHARLAQDRPRPGAGPARRGRVRHGDRAGRPARRLPAARRGRRRAARRALPAGDDHAEDAPLPQLHVRQPGPPALGAALSLGGVASGRRCVASA